MTRGPAHYSLVQFERDGLLLNLTTGSLFHMNESATLVWSGFIAGKSETTMAEALSQRYRLPLATAVAHVARALALHPDAAEATPPTQPYLYERTTANLYTLSRDGAPLLTIDARGDSVRLSRAGSVPADELPMVLQAVAPKLMALRDHFVLHASAVVVGSTVLGFCGKSGSGKTTTARALVRAGAAPVCEDKLVVRSQAGRLEAFIRGELLIKSWVSEAAAILADGGTASCAGLDRAAEGEAVPFGSIGCLAADRREGQSIVAAPLSHSQAASAMFSNAFHGSDLVEDWRQHLEAAAHAACAVPAYDVSMPLGVRALESAAVDIVNRKTFP